MDHAARGKRISTLLRWAYLETACFSCKQFDNHLLHLTLAMSVNDKCALDPAIEEDAAFIDFLQKNTDVWLLVREYIRVDSEPEM